MKSFDIFAKQAIAVLFLMLFIGATAQDYRTIRVNGTIVLERENIPLETGTVFEEEDNLIFKTQNSIATVINPQKGRFILRPDNTDLAYARASYTPAMSNISSRSGAFMTALDLKNHLDGRYVFFDENYLTINPEIFPMNEEKFFFLRYQYNGDTINKKLAFNHDTLLIRPHEVFSIDNTPVDYTSVNEVELWYMERDEGNKITLLNKFEPVVINNDELMQELQIIFDIYSDKPEKQVRQEAFSYIHEFYGTLNKENFEYWMTRYMEN